MLSCVIVNKSFGSVNKFLLYVYCTQAIEKSVYNFVKCAFLLSLLSFISTVLEKYLNVLN